MTSFFKNLGVVSNDLSKGDETRDLEFGTTTGGVRFGMTGVFGGESRSISTTVGGGFACCFFEGGVTLILGFGRSGIFSGVLRGCGKARGIGENAGSAPRGRIRGRL